MREKLEFEKIILSAAAIDAAYHKAIVESNRVIIENSFGLWKNKWRRLRHLDMDDMPYMSRLITATMVLHNLCLAENEEYESEQNSESETDADSEEEDNDYSGADGAGGAHLIAAQKRNNIMQNL